MRETVFRFGEYSVGDGERVLRRDGIITPLPPKAISCLLVLLEADGRTVSKSEMLQAVWPDTYVEEANLPQTVSVLRKALTEGFPDTSPIETIARIGYIFRSPVSAEIVDSETEDPSPQTQEDVETPHPVMVVTSTHSGSRVVSVGYARPIIWVLAGLVAIVLLALALSHWYSNTHRPWLSGPLKMVALTPGSGWELNPAISPDGTQLAYSVKHESDASYSIYIKPLFSGDEGRKLDLGTNDALKPAWSPDAKRLTFLSLGTTDSAIKIVNLADGRVEVVEKRPELGPPSVPPTNNGGWNGAIWSSDGNSLIFNHYSDSTSAHLVELDLRSGRRTDLTFVVEDQMDGRPALSPDGKTMVFLRVTLGKASLQLLDLSNQHTSPLLASWSGSNGLSWSADGSEIITSGNPEGEDWSVWRIPVRGGEPVRMSTQNSGNASDPVLAAKGKVLAYTAFERSTNMELVPTLDGSIPARTIAPSKEFGLAPSVSPDGRQLAYLSSRSGQMEIWLAPVVDAPETSPRKLTNGLKIERGDTIAWSPDSRTLAVGVNAAQNYIMMVDFVTGKFAKLQTPGLEGADIWGPIWSADGRWVYAFSNISGTAQEYRLSPGTVPLAEQVPGLPNGNTYFETTDWGYFVGAAGFGFYRQHFKVAGFENSQPEIIKGLEDVVPGPNWQAADGGILFIDQHAAVRKLQRWDAHTGRITNVTGPLPRVDFDYDFNYVPSKHFVVYPQYRESAGAQIYGLIPKSP